MPEDYAALVTALKASGIPFAEYSWEMRPDGDYGAVQLEFEADADYGDDLKVARAWEGSVDLFMRGRNANEIQEVETILTEICDGCWRLNSIQHERETGLMHYEWVFQVEE